MVRYQKFIVLFAFFSCSEIIIAPLFSHTAKTLSLHILTTRRDLFSFPFLCRSLWLKSSFSAFWGLSTSIERPRDARIFHQMRMMTTSFITSRLVSVSVELVTVWMRLLLLRRCVRIQSLAAVAHQWAKLVVLSTSKPQEARGTRVKHLGVKLSSLRKSATRRSTN